VRSPPKVSASRCRVGGEKPLEQLRSELRRRGTRAEILLADLSDREQAATLVERAEAKIGPVDLLINNAGIEIVPPSRRSPTRSSKR
jgi:short-subunit dehydrogenase